MSDSQEARVRALEIEVKRLIERLTRRESAVEPTPRTGTVQVLRSPSEAVAPRRHVIRNVALATGGVIAGSTVLAKPAFANDPLDLTLGSSKTTAGLTGGSSTSVGTAAAFMFQAGTTWAPTSSAYGCALAGWTTVPSKPVGVYGWTNQPGGHAFVGVGAAANTTGALLTGIRANTYLQPSGALAPSRSDAHLTGDLVSDGFGNLWFCVASGTPGTWRKLAGPTTAGSFHALTPGRVYDSRATQPLPGALNSGSTKTISVANRRNTVGGAIVESNFVPAGASAVFCNVTVIPTAGSGYLAVNPGGVTAINASTIHWPSPGHVVDNGIAAKLDGNRQLTVVAAGGGATHFLIDVMGYYL